MKISGVVPVVDLEDTLEGRFTIEGDTRFVYMKDKDKITRLLMTVYNANSEFKAAFRIGKPIRVTVEVLDESNDAGEN